MMKKLLILMLVLGLTNAASAVIQYDLSAVEGTGGEFSIDISVSDPGGAGATHVIGTGELLLTITGDATITDVSALIYDPTNAYWDPMFIQHQEIVAADGLSGQFGASTLMTSAPFWLAIGNIAQGNIIVTLASGVATVTVTPNNAPNAFGNTLYYDGTSSIVDTQATGSSIEIPEPMTIALLGLGGLFMLRRRRK